MHRNVQRLAHHPAGHMEGACDMPQLGEIIEMLHRARHTPSLEIDDVGSAVGGSEDLFSRTDRYRPFGVARVHPVCFGDRRDQLHQMRTVQIDRFIHHLRSGRAPHIQRLVVAKDYPLRFENIHRRIVDALYLLGRHQIEVGNAAIQFRQIVDVVSYPVCPADGPAAALRIRCNVHFT